MDVLAIYIRLRGHRDLAHRKYHQVSSQLVLRLLACVLAAQVIALPADYIGAAQCKSCHSKIFDTQSRSAHAGALSKTAQHPRIGDLPILDTWARAPGISSNFKVTADGLLARVSDKSEERTVTLDWAFGAGTQGITFLGKLPGQAYLEFSLSYYTKKHVFGITPGHEPIRPETVAQALGRPFETYSSSGEIMECFQCHSTGPVTVSPDDSIAPNEMGIRCEGCHGPGSDHRNAASKGLKSEAIDRIQSPGRLSAAGVNDFCGTCHRRQTPGRALLDLTYSWNVRHQPPYLEQSACFRRSEGKLSCLTCHNPHESTVRDSPQFYDSKCEACHNGKSKQAVMCKTPAKGSCIECHMPVVRPSEYMEFRSHWIGVYPPQGSASSARFAVPRS